MKTVKSIPKKALSVFLALIMVAGYFALAVPVKAQAAGQTGYKVRVSLYIIDWTSYVDGASMTLKYKSDYGTGSEGSMPAGMSVAGSASVGVNIVDAFKFQTVNSTFYYEFTTPAYCFPTTVDVFFDAGNDGGCNAKDDGATWSVNVDVYNYNTSSYDRVFTGASSGDQTNTTRTETIGTDKYPAVNAVSVSGANSVVVQTGSSVTSAYSVAATDQYGVDWNKTPSWSLSSTSGMSISSGTLTVNASSAAADSSVTVNASYGSKAGSKTVTLLKPHTISINANGGTYTGSTSISAHTGDTISLGTTTKTGYTFAGWSVSAGSVSGNTVTVGNAANSTVTANWTPVTYTVNYDANGGTVGTTSATYNITSTTLNVPTPTRAGYTFTNWTVSSAAGNWTSGGVVSSAISGKYGNITAKANWTPNNYTLNFDPNTGSVDTPSKTVTFDSEVGTLPTPSKDAYDFTGWFTQASGGSLVTSSSKYTTADNSTVYAQWTPHAYTASFDTNGGDALGNYSYSTESGTLPAATRTGYTFSKWEVVSTDGNWGAAGTQYNAGTSTVGKNGAVSFKAIWIANPYTITYDLNDSSRVGAASCDSLTKAVTYDSQIGTLSVPNFDGYTFDGWFTSATAGTEVTSETVYKTAGGMTVYAHWTPIEYTATFNAAGGDAVASVTYDIETEINFSATTRTGYTFVSWTTDATVGNWAAAEEHFDGDSVDGMYGDVSFTASWDDNDYTMTFDKNDTTGIGSASCDTASKTVTYDSAVGTVPTATRTGYTFDGWFTEATGGTLVDASTVYKTAGDSTVYAHWTATEYTITYDVNNGTAIAPVTFTIEDDITLAIPQRTGFTFNYWIITSANDGSWVKNTNYTAGDIALGTGNYGNVTVKAIYTIKQFTITWDVNGETTTSLCMYGAIPTLPPTPTADDACYDYTFTGWTPSVVVATADTTYTAEFSKTPKVYTVTWEDDDGTELYSENVAYGASIPTKAVPTRTGYTAEWSAVPATMPASDYTITASYTINKYTISWVTPDGTTTEEYDYNTMPSYKGTTPVKASTVSTDYTFSGWTPALSTVSGAATYTAQFSESVRQYTVTWDANGTVTTEKYNYGSTPSYKGSTPVKDQSATTVYTFDGWTPTIGSVDSDITYTAHFAESARTYTVTWTADGSTVYTETVAYGSAIPSKTVPAKTGYTGAWDAVPATMPASDYTIDAVYTPIKYTITWSIDGVDTTAQWDYDSTPVYSGTPVKAADAEYTYAFDSWTPTVSKVTGAATYTAQFTKTANEYQLEWVADGVVIRTDTIAFGTTITNIPTVPPKTNYAAAWDTIPLTMPAANTTINAIYTFGARTITWMINGAGHTSICMDGNVPTYSGTVDKAATAEYTYTFAGWSATDGGAVIASLPAVSGSDTTYYAVFTSTANSYTAKWMADGAEVFNETVAYGSAIPSKTVPAKTGYTGVWDKTTSTMPAEDITFTAVYTPIPYTVNWSVNGVVTSETWNYDTTPSFTGSTDKAMSATTVYTFAGWSATDGGTVLASIPSVTGTVTYYAIYTETARPYTFTWYDDDSTTVLFTETVNYGTAIPSKTVPSRTGYTGAWTAVPSTMPASDYSVSAVYTPIKYTITWAMPTGNVTAQWDYDSTPSYTGTTPVKDSTVSTVYTFAGWDKTIGKVTGDTTYTATFTEITRQYTITWVVNGVTTTALWAYGSTPAFTGSTDKASTATVDYTFAGWDNTIASVSGDATYTATYTESARKYTVTWKADGAVAYTESVANGTTIPNKTVPSKTGYTGAWASVPATMPTKNIVITAVYTPIKYTVTWSMPSGDLNEQWDYDSTPAYSGATPTKPSTAEHEYSFTGWSPAIDKVSGDVTYTAQFSETNRKYTVTWVADGVIVDTQEIEYSAAIPNIAVPEKTGFTGVWSSIYSTMPAQNISISAIYSAHLYTIYWKVDGITRYAESLAYGATIPNKDVPEKTGYTGHWDSTMTTMPGNNVVINAVYEVKTYSIQWTLNGNTGNDTVSYGTTYSTTFTYADLPDEIRVSVDGKTIANTLYTYNQATGDFSILASAVTGDISIYGKTDTGTYEVIASIGNCQLNNTTSAKRHTVFHTELVPAAGFLLPDSVEVYVGGVRLTSGYTYEKSTGKLTVNAETVTGDIEILADCPVDPNYDPNPQEPDDNDDEESGSGLFGSLHDLLMRIIKFFKKIFGMK